LKSGEASVVKRYRIDNFVQTFLWSTSP